MPREIGVRAVVKDFGRYMGQIKQVAGAGTKASSDMADATKTLELANAKLEAQMVHTKHRMAELAESKKDMSTLIGVLSANYDIMEHKLGMNTEKLNKMRDEAGKTDIDFAALAGTLGKVSIATGAVAAATASFAFYVKLASAAIKLYLTPLKLMINVIRSVVGAVFNLAKSLLNLGVNIIKGVVTKALDLLRDGLRAATQALKSLIEEAWAGAKAFQHLEIRFQGLVANEIIATTGTENFAGALAAATGPAAELLNWIQQLAVTTPFTRKDIGDTVAFSMAMGFTSAEAQRLTLAIGDFVSGMGLGTEVMERVILQFGQMKAGGRLFGTELRDLARGAFVPVNDILEKVAENLDMTAREWQELAARGEVDITPFFEEFINMAQNRFPGAMDRMNQTLEAALQNMHDFVQEFLGVKALGPAVDRVAEAIGGILEQISTSKAMYAFELLGRSIERVTDSLIELGGAITEAIFGTKDLEEVVFTISAVLAAIADEISWWIDEAIGTVNDGMDLMGKSIAQVALEAFKWGVNIVTNLAMGIIEAGANVLVWAMNAISDLLSWWLSGQSPPRVAPDLPAWGSNAMLEFLKGMTNADFSILESVQGPIKSILNVFGKMGTLGRNEIGPMFAEISRSLIGSLATGGLGEETINLIKNTMGEFSGEILKLINKEIALQKALEAVEQAELSLEQVRSRHAKSITKVHEEQAEYNRLLRSGASREVLRAQMERLNAAERERNEAEAAIPAAEEAVQVAKERSEQAQEERDHQRNLVDQLIKIAEAQHDIKEESTAAGRAAKGLSGGIDDVRDSLAGATQEGGTFKDTLNDIFNKARWEFRFMEIKRNVAGTIHNIFEGVGEQWVEQVTPAIETLTSTFDTFKTNTIYPLLEALGIDTTGGYKFGTGWVYESSGETGLSTAIKFVSGALDGLHKVWLDDIKPAFETARDELLPALENMFYAVATAAGVDITGKESGLVVAVKLVTKYIEGLNKWLPLLVDIATAFFNIVTWVLKLIDAWNQLPDVIKGLPLEILLDLLVPGHVNLPGLIGGGSDNTLPSGTQTTDYTEHPNPYPGYNPGGSTQQTAPNVHPPVPVPVPNNTQSNTQVGPNYIYDPMTGEELRDFMRRYHNTL